MSYVTQKRLCLCFAAMLLAGGAGAEERFHAPRSAEEKALNKILWLSDYNRGFLDYVFADANRNPKHDGDFAKNVTKEFRDAVIAYEKKLAKNTCDGKFRGGRVCGYDANPLTCRSSESEYFYITQSNAKNVLTIDAIAADQIILDDILHYKLIKKGSGWALDGVQCPGGLSFHFKDADKEKKEGK